MLVLDTCVLLWIASDPEQLSEAALDAIEALDARLCVSAFSALEIGIKNAKGKLDLGGLSTEAWFDAALERYAIEPLPLTWRAAARSTRLPTIHNDPADRAIIATTIEARATLITPDHRIRQYPGVRVIW